MASCGGHVGGSNNNDEVVGGASSFIDDGMVGGSPFMGFESGLMDVDGGLMGPLDEVNAIYGFAPTIINGGGGMWEDGLGGLDGFDGSMLGGSSGGMDVDMMVMDGSDLDGMPLDGGDGRLVGLDGANGMDGNGMDGGPHFDGSGLVSGLDLKGDRPLVGGLG
ncbi:uncharacterized protein LOC131254967 [Magnolia sinica]|uniref:uncharacterized protein LOC131254967 n=1 Tax=Magnolia sinica TaxID=86752 RepID=UPI002658ADBB|nr:uncharacterized protein LOC131254967 [Magnolia sinica]